MKIAVLCAFLVGLGGVTYFLVGWGDEPQGQAKSGQVGKALVDISIPDALSANAKIGKVAFQAKCATCHGEAAVGQQGVAPPLIHKIYEPSHHGDEAFQRAAASGVTSHHWSFGNMPPVDGLTRADVSMVVAYIRELQQANGIH